MANAGRVAIVPKGEYSATVAYKRLDLVRYNNDLYIAKKANTGVAPTDSETWMLSLENVSQTQYDDLINGTTAVGNALKLNGLTAEEFLNSISPYFVSGETILSWANNPNGVYKKFVIHPNVPSDVPIQAEGWCELLIDKQKSRKIVKFTTFGSDNSIAIYSRSIWDNAWRGSGWTYSADGGNADTVDGFHASDFQQTNDLRTMIGKFNFTTPTDIRTIMRYLPSGAYTYATGLIPNLVTPFESTVGMMITWQRIQEEYDTANGYHHGVLTVKTLADNSKCYTCTVFNNSLYTEWVDSNPLHYLPLDGSVPMSGALKIGDGTQTLLAELNGGSVGGYIDFLCEGVRAGGITVNKNGNFVFYDTGARDVLHTGNSQKVVTSASAPSGTSALWVDTANKKVKAYIDGAWTAMA